MLPDLCELFAVKRNTADEGYSGQGLQCHTRVEGQLGDDPESASQDNSPSFFANHSVKADFSRYRFDQERLR